jgi:cytochrome c peroxidase
MRFHRQLMFFGTVGVFLSMTSVAPRAHAQSSLKTVKVPAVPNLSQYVRNHDALIVLGKALFWDMQLSSDGRVACASCHFHAGADHRLQNQISNPLGSIPLNHTLTADEFPFHVLSNSDDNRSVVLRDTPQRAASSGQFRRTFSDINQNTPADSGSDASDRPAFSDGNLNLRQVTVRNTPTVINAAYYFHNFWDGRASNIFTGRTPFGLSDARSNALVNRSGQLTAEAVRLENSSLASQAVGPPLNGVEMSYDGRSWVKVGKKMLVLHPLAQQRIAPDDSVLGPFANANGRGLKPEIDYAALVQTAFQPEYWNSTQLVDIDGTPLGNSGAEGFAQAEFNFSLMFGLSIAAYESTLISDDSRFDQFAEGNGRLTSQEENGRQIFNGRGGCSGCHRGAEFTAAAYSTVDARGPVQGAGNGVAVDTGFFRTGVRPAAEDIGLGDVDDFGRPFSVAVAQNPGLNVKGVFKTPTLRNIEFTGPFFHNGGQATLDQVVDFYARGGDFTDGGVGRGLRPRSLSMEDRAALVAFMMALSDDRVRFERAPFDHPELCVSTGHAELAPNVLQPDTADPHIAADKWAAIPAVGRDGNTVPLQTFDELLRGIGADGSRAHSLTDRCSI